MPSQEQPEHVLYLRKSKGRAGIARQRTTTTAYIEASGGRVVAEFTDTDRTAYQKAGAARPKRDGFRAMLAMLRANPGLTVAAWHADRLTRNEEDTAELGRVCAEGGHLIVTKSGGSYDMSTANGRKRFRDDASDAQYEVDHNRERVLEKKAEAFTEGRWLGGRRPFGWRIDKEAPGGLVLDDEEAEALRGAYRDVLGRRSLHGIARAWNDRGVLTSTGARWRASEVRRVLLRPMNAAPPPACWPAITEEETHRAVTGLLLHPDRKTTTGPERRHLLSGIAACECGQPLACSVTIKNGQSRHVYRCRAGETGHVARDAVSLEAVISELVIGRLSMPDARNLVMPDTGGRLTVLRGERTAVEGLMKESNGLRRRGLLSAAEFAEERAEHMGRLARLDADIAAAEETDVLAPWTGSPEQVRAKWEAADLDARRAVVGVLMRITVKPSPKGRPKGWRKGQRYFDLDSVQIEWKRGTV